MKISLFLDLIGIQTVKITFLEYADRFLEHLKKKNQKSNFQTFNISGVCKFLF